MPCPSRSLQRLQSASPRSRSPFLSEIELLRRNRDYCSARGAGCTLGVDHAIGELTVRYLERFCDKPCCFADVLPHLVPRRAAQASVVAQRHRIAWQVSCVDRPAKQAEVQLSARLSRQALWGRDWNANALRVRARLSSDRCGPRIGPELWYDQLQLTAAWQQTGGHHIALLATERLVGAKMELGTAARAKMEAVLLLEGACKAHASAAAYPFMLRLVELYAQLDAFEPAIRLYNQLEIKQIQLETLSPLVVDGCHDHAFFVEALSHCDTIIAFHKDAAREASDHAVHALDGSRPLCAMKLLRFQDEQMRPSAQLAFAQVSRTHLRLLLEHHSIKDAREALCASSLAWRALADDDVMRLRVHTDGILLPRRGAALCRSMRRCLLELAMVAWALHGAPAAVAEHLAALHTLSLAPQNADQIETLRTMSSVEVFRAAAALLRLLDEKCPTASAASEAESACKCAEALLNAWANTAFASISRHDGRVASIRASSRFMCSPGAYLGLLLQAVADACARRHKRKQKKNDAASPIVLVRRLLRSLSDAGTQAFSRVIEAHRIPSGAAAKAAAEPFAHGAVLERLRASRAISASRLVAIATEKRAVLPTA